MVLDNHHYLNHAFDITLVLTDDKRHVSHFTFEIID